MKFSIRAIGRLKNSPEKILFEQYKRRIVWPCQIIELETSQKQPKSKIKLEESSLLKKGLPKRDIIIGLDERGRNLSSIAFAAKIGQFNDNAQNVTFLIGGVYGLEDNLKTQCDLIMALGKMTWPHLLVRVLLLEQLYRAQQILAGHPYHKE